AMKRTTAAPWALYVGLLVMAPVDPGLGHAQTAPALPARLAAAVENADLGDRVGVSVVAIASGEEIYGHHEGLPLNPASNMKLVTAAAALAVWGPERRFTTHLRGRVEAGAVDPLVLEGG